MHRRGKKALSGVFNRSHGHWEQFTWIEDSALYSSLLLTRNGKFTAEPVGQKFMLTSTSTKSSRISRSFELAYFTSSHSKDSVEKKQRVNVADKMLAIRASYSSVFTALLRTEGI